MIKVEAIEPFTLGKFEEIKDSIVRKGVDTPGQLNIGDTFECSKEMAEYLTGKNERGKVVVKVIEIIPEKVVIKEEPKVEEKKEVKPIVKPATKTTKKKISKK